MHRVYFCFDYSRDLERVKKIYQLPNVLSRSAGGFQTSEVWQGAAKRGDAAAKGLINDALMNTTVTVVCIGSRTSHGKFLVYELERSLEMGNGLVGIKINHLPDQDGIRDKDVPVPPVIEEEGFKVYAFSDKRELAAHIDEAAELAKQRAQGAD